MLAVFRRKTNHKTNAVSFRLDFSIVQYTIKTVYKLTAARKHVNYSTQTRTFLHAKTQFCPRKHANTQTRKHASTQTRRRVIKAVLSQFLIIHNTSIITWAS